MESGAEAKPSANGRFFKLYFIHASSLSTVAPDIYDVRVVSIRRIRVNLQSKNDNPAVSQMAGDLKVPPTVSEKASA